jgi:hypothetical protein
MPARTHRINPSLFQVGPGPIDPIQSGRIFMHKTLSLEHLQTKKNAISLAESGVSLILISL